MKKIVPFLLLTLFSYSLQAQNKLAIETSFALPSTLLSDMKLYVMTGKMKRELRGVKLTKLAKLDNPVTTRDETILSYFVQTYIEDVEAVYSERWIGKQELEDAGVIVIQYKSSALLQKHIEELYALSNVVYLIKDNFLIQAGSNRGKERESDLAKLSAHYQNTLKAKIYIAQSPAYTEETEEAPLKEIDNL